jgi:hypothetical protein
MGLNVENLFVHASDSEHLLLEIQNLAAGAAADAGAPGWEAPVSVPTHDLTRRRLAISPVRGGWFQICTSDEAIEPFIAMQLSKRLNTDVITIQVYEIAGASGYTHCRGGEILRSQWSETSPDPLGGVQTMLTAVGIEFTPILFSEAVRMRQQGWLVQSFSKRGAA